jgi:hypothetical protein
MGPELGGEFEYAAVFVFEDLHGYWQYLEHPAHLREERTGMELIERFEVVDITGSDDPEIGEEIARLQVRDMEEHPEIAALVAEVPWFTVLDGKGSAA